MESLQTHQPIRETRSLKTTRDYLNIIDAYQELGSYRAAALLCGATDRTVRRVVERHEAGGPWTRRPRLPTPRNTDSVLLVLAKKVKDTDGRISAKRLLPVARAAGYSGSARNLRRAVAKIKTDHRRKRRLYQPWVPTPGQRPGHRLDPGGGAAHLLRPAGRCFTDSPFTRSEAPAEWGTDVKLCNRLT